MDMHLPMSFITANTLTVEDPYLNVEVKNNVFKRKIILNGLKLLPSTIELYANALTKEQKESSWGRSLVFLAGSFSAGGAGTFVDVASMATALRTALAKNKIEGWLFCRGDNQALLPYKVTAILSEKYTSNYSDESYDKLSLVLRFSSGETNSAGAITEVINPLTLLQFFITHKIEHEAEYRVTKRGRDRTQYLARVTAKAAVPIELWLHNSGYFLETKTFHKKYQEQIENYLKLLQQYGSQILVRGSSISSKSMLQEGKPSRAIVATIPSCIAASQNPDDQDYDEERRRRRNRMSDQSGDDNSYSQAAVESLRNLQLEDIQVSWLNEDEDLRYVLPIHPILSIFHLDFHDFYQVHITNAKLYEYKKDLASNLILPKNVKQLTKMLVATTQSENKQDIIENKSQAQIIACVGDPGLGKTLLAEVMAESCEKPLYKIQAAQLGLDAEELESNLRLLLRRAERWGAVVMIDEANAYIHSRGHDIQQNAIVGVFLRLLEYFRGTMIVTTNLTTADAGFDIDDAILSRCTAVFQFKLPSRKQRLQIWNLQASLLGVDLDPKLADKAAETYRISGRTIRHLLRLSSNWAKSLNEELSMGHLDTCYQFTPRTVSENATEHTDDKE